MPDATEVDISALHATPACGVLAITGGGSGAIGRLLAVPGASRTVLEAVVPYARPALEDWVGGRVDGSCSEPTARAMAMASMQRAIVIATRQDEATDTSSLFGVGCTASLASDRPKRGDHRLHVALQTNDETVTWSVTLAKGKRTRDEEESVVEALVLHAVAYAAGIAAIDCQAAARDDEPIVIRQKRAPELWRQLIFGDGGTALVDPSHDPENFADEPRCKRLLLPGAFAPPHDGHRLMAELAEQRYDQPVTFELCVANVDKPPLDYLALEERLTALAQIGGGREVWLTRLPTFRQKAHQLGVKTFIVGADTITRVADARYYRNVADRDDAIREMAKLGCRFLVFGREGSGDFATLEDLNLPPSLRALCDGVPEAEFRVDVSSTQLRSQERDAGV